MIQKYSSLYSQRKCTGFNFVNLLNIYFQFKRSDWAKTVITYQTDKPQRLPILDVAVRDIGEEDQSFWLEIGPVCFT